MSRFDRERKDWQRLQRVADTSPGLLNDFRRAVEEVMKRYDTAIRENRFVVGGAIEVFLGALLRAVGIPVVHRGALDARRDLRYEDDPACGFSVKALLRSPGTRLVNVMGRKPHPGLWDHAVLFVVPQGIVYADPDLPWWLNHRDRYIRVRSDALEIRRRGIEAFLQESPDWFLPVSFTWEEDQDRRGVKTASVSVALDVLKEIGGDLFRQVGDLWPSDSG